LKERSKVFWHEAFVEALQLEFHSYLDYLVFDAEYPLSKEALIMDVLVIKKEPNQIIRKNIGRILKGHNIFEFKSESDSITQHDYNKVTAYALLYSSFTQIPVSDITVSFVITPHPRSLLKYLEYERGLAIQTQESGIYYVIGDIFPVQILESKALSPEENLFLRNLRSNLTTEDIAQTTKSYKSLKSFETKNVYFNRLMQANSKTIKEAIHMFDKDIIEIILADEVKEVIMNGAEERGWFAARDFEKAKSLAKKLLSRGDTIAEVAEVTELSYETVANLA